MAASSMLCSTNNNCYSLSGLILLCSVRKGNGGFKFRCISGGGGCTSIKYKIYIYRPIYCLPCVAVRCNVKKGQSCEFIQHQRV